MAHLHLPATLTPLFADLPRRIDADGETVAEAIGDLERRWPGLRDRLCENGTVLRPHINVFVDKHRADLATPIDERSQVDVIAAITGG